jgi:acyl carrier protein
MTDTTFESIRDIICRVAKIEPSDVRPENPVTGLVNVDSIVLLEIVARTELEFGIDIDETDLFEISTVADFVAVCSRLQQTADAVGRSGT